MPRKAKTAPAQRTRASAKVTPVQEETMPMKKESFMLHGDMWKKFKTVLAPLAAIYLVIWILIGLFVLLVVVQGIRRGQYAGLIGNSSQSQPTAQNNTQTPSQTEVNLPGIGMVNVSCVQQALSADSLQKVIQSRSIDVLSGDEKARFQACITQPAASGSAAASPSAQP